MKILVLSHISDFMGGAEQSLVDIFDSWTKNHDIEPEFILREPVRALGGELDKRGWKYHALRYTFWSEVNPPSRAEDIFRASLINVRAIEDIEEIIKKSKPDAVMTNTIICPWAALAAHYQDVPHVWIVREYGDLDHGRQFEIGRQPTFEDIGNLSNLVVANSATLAKHVSRYVDEKKVTFLYNPFDIEKVDSRANAKVDNPYRGKDSLKLIITSRVAPSKGQLDVVKAIGKLSKDSYDVELCIVGENDNKDYADELQRTISEYGIQNRVHFVGHQANPLAYVALADVGVITSRMEAFGRTTFEYLMIGKPVVGADSGATPELVQTGKCAYLFKPGDVKEIATAIKKYADNKKLISEHGRVARKRALELLSGEHNIDALYEKVKMAAAGKGEPKPAPINFNHHFIDYLENAEKFIKDSGAVSLKKLARSRLRGKAKSAYWRIRTVKGRITGR